MHEGKRSPHEPCPGGPDQAALEQMLAGFEPADGRQAV